MCDLLLFLLIFYSGAGYVDGWIPRPSRGWTNLYGDFTEELLVGNTFTNVRRRDDKSLSDWYHSGLPVTFDAKIRDQHS